MTDQRPAVAEALRTLRGRETAWVSLGGSRFKIRAAQEEDDAEGGLQCLIALNGQYLVALLTNKDGLRVYDGPQAGRRVQWSAVRAIVLEAHKRTAH